MTTPITVAGRTLTITPLKVKDLPAFMAAVEPLAAALGEGDLLGALSRHADQVVAATAIGAQVEPAWLGEQEVDVLVQLAAAVLEVNADFFSRRVLPQVLAAADKINQIGFGGTTLSPASSAPASTTPA